MSANVELERPGVVPQAPSEHETRVHRDATTTIIEPARAWPSLNLREIWTHRGLFFFLVWRDIKVRYAQTVLGVGWAILQPAVSAAIFTIIFGRIAKMGSDGVPYPVFSFAAMVPWSFFAAALAGSANSLITNPELITKVYFPRLVIPIAPVLASMVDFCLSTVVLLVIMLGFGMVPTPWAVIVLPIVALLAALAAAGAGTWLSALNVQYRDIKHVTPFLVQIWMYSSPVVFPLSKVPAKYQPFYALNPMVGAIEGMRTALLGTGPVRWELIGISALSALALLVTGALYFRHTERVFADVA